MENFSIKTTDFNDAKNKLKKFSEEIPSEVQLPTVETNGWLWFDHQVTGKELNEITEKVQDCFISNNDKINKVIKEFGQVYNALEALDKDYIQAIIISIKAAEEASNQAQKVAKEAMKNSIDIRSTIDIQKKTILSLSQFKAQLSDYKNLENIDTIWNDLQLLKKDLSLLNTKIISIDENKTKQELITKIKTANVLAGTSMFITLTLFVLNLMKII